MKPTKGSKNLLMMIAIISMLIDHMGVLIFPDQPWMRWVGRIAFPIFCYGIAEGFTYTSSRKRYALRLFLFALISQLPYQFLNYNMEYQPRHFNVLFLLLLGLGILWLVEQVVQEKKWRYIPVGILGIVLPEILKFYISGFTLSYGSYGLLMIVLFYLVKKPLPLFIGYVALSVYYGFSAAFMELISQYSLEQTMLITKNYLTGNFIKISQNASIVALPIIENVRRSPVELELPKFVFYIFYPLHISILLLAHMAVF